MSELKRQIGRRVAMRIAILGAWAILTGCEKKEKEHLWGVAHRNSPQRQRLLAKVRAGYPTTPKKASKTKKRKS